MSGYVGTMLKKHVNEVLIPYYENCKEPKMFDFGALQRKMQMSSYGKNLIHMLFWEFYGTPRIKGRGWRRKGPCETS